MTDTPPIPEPSLRDRARKSVFWGVGLNFVTRAGSIVLTLILARLLPPEILGQYTTVNTIILFLMAFSMSRFAESLFFEKTPSPEDLHRHFGFGVVLHSALFVIANVIAVVFGFIPDLASLQVFMHVASIAILLNVPRTYYQVYLRYELDFKRIRLLGLVAFGLFAVSSILIAMAGGGVYAYLAQDLVIPLPYIVALLFAHPDLKNVRFDFSLYRHAIRFGIIRTGSSGARTGYEAIQSLTFSTLLSFGAFGLFTRAKGLSSLMSGYISDQTLSIVYPALAKLEPKTEPSRRACGILFRVALWSAVPVALCGALAPEPLVLLLIGGDWLGAAPLLRPMLVAMTAQTLIASSRTLILTNESAMKLLLVDIVLICIFLASLATLPFVGLETFVVIFAATRAVVAAGLLVLLSIRGVVLGREMLQMWAPCLVAMAVGVGIAVTPGFQAWAEQLPIVAIPAGGAVIGASMLIAVRVLDGLGLRRVCELLPGRRILERVLLLKAAR